MDAERVIILLIALAILAYLAWALLNPERL